VQAVAASSNNPVPRYRPGIPGSSPFNLELEDLDGVWTLSFGRFGWKDYETRGAIVRIEDGLMFGGGSNFVYRGVCTIVGDNAVQVSFDVDRYRADPNFVSTTGIQEADHFHVTCIIDALTADHLEGRIANEDRASRDVLPEVRLTLVRYGSL
jgi:hypothetical protein